MQVDLSPISLRALTACRSTVGLVQLASQYNITSVNVLQRLAGAGYRVRARLMSNQSKRWTRLKVAAGKPFRSGQLPLEFLIGRGSPLNPYLKGKMVAYLLREIRPKEIKLFPQELVFDGEREILERTVLFNWMKQWLRWVSWYHTEAQSPTVSLDQLLNAPICASSWKRSNVDINLYKFGLVWRLYDMAAGWSVSTTPQWLFDPQTIIKHDRWILGGYKGTDFIMAPVDLPSTEE